MTYYKHAAKSLPNMEVRHLISIKLYHAYIIQNRDTVTKMVLNLQNVNIMILSYSRNVTFAYRLKDFHLAHIRPILVVFTI